MQSAKLCKHINSILSHGETSSIDHITTNDTVASDPVIIAETLNSHFINATGPPPHNASQPTLQPPVTTPSSLLDLTPTTQKEVLKIIQDLNPRRSSGPSRNNTVCLQLTAPSISQSLATLFNLSLTTGAFPTIWKVADITPVFKKGDKSDPGNHRPNSVIPVVGKVLERLAPSRLSNYLSIHNIVTPHQSGFRAGHSTEHVLVKTI